MVSTTKATAITLVESQEHVEERKGEKRVERQSPVGGPNSFT